MKVKLSLKHFLLELLLAAAVAGVFNLFFPAYFFWFSFCLLVLLIWHHHTESSLLQLLRPNEQSGRSKVTTMEHLSQSAAFYHERLRQDKIKTLRLLSKLNKHIQYLPNAIIICQENGEISWCNNVAQELFEFYWDKKSNKSIFNVIFYPEFKSYFRQQRHHRPLVLLTHNKRYIELNLNRYDSNSRLIVARDVTSFVRLMHSRQTFLANMNHELRTPLTILQGYLEMLENEPHNMALQQKALNAMKEQSQRMTNLLRQLSLLVKIEHSNDSEHNEVQMSALISAIQKNTEILSQNQQILFDIEPNLTVWGDQEQLQSAVSNLIYNAIRHAGEGVTIQICCQRDNQEPNTAIFSVQDDGIGINAHHITHLTERFYRVDESRSNKTGGSGLGLAIVKHALEQHHSTLEIESEAGKGSRFSFKLPLIKK